MDEFENPFTPPREPDPLPTEWVGAYSYDPSFDMEVELAPVSFAMSWVRRGNGKIKGTVNDGLESAMQETGTINGFFRNGEIEFTKYMPVATLMNPDGSSSRSNHRHPPINYFGKYDEATRTLDGTWYITPCETSVGVFGKWTAASAEGSDAASV